MVSNRKSQRNPSLAIKTRQKKQLFLPMDTVDADRLALRFHVALSSVLQGTAEAPDVYCLAQTVVMTALIADLDGSNLDMNDLTVSEECMCRRLAYVELAHWRLDDVEAHSLRNVINEHDRQLHQTRLQTLVRATERFERLLKRVDTLADVFDARRQENSRHA